MNTATNAPPPDLRQIISAGLSQLHQRQQTLALVVMAVGLVLALILHLAAAYHFPIPWDDEAHFLVPARNLAAGMGLVAPQLNAPQGMFWMPDGYMLLMGAVYAFTGPSLAVARWVSFGLVMMSVVCLYLTGRRMGLPQVLVALLLTLWLIAPRVVVLGNAARMEVLVVTLLCVALVLAVHDRWLLAVAVAALLPLAHPVGLPLFFIFPVVAILFGRSLRPHDRLSWLLIVGVAALWLFEIVRFAQNMDVAQAHLGYQFLRKEQAPILLTPLHLALLAINLHGALTGWLMARRRHGTRHQGRLAGLVLMFVLGAALVMIHPLGREQWYVVYSIEVANVIMLMALGGLWRLLRVADAPVTWKRPPFRVMPHLMALSMAIVIVPNLLSSAAQTEPVYSFANLTIAGDSRAEWAGFLDGVEAELRALDEALDAPALVHVDRITNIDTLLTDRAWQNLRLVQTTPVTPLAEDVQVDFMLFVSGPPLWRTFQIEARFPGVEPSVHIVSSTGRFHLYIFDVRQGD